jgi:phosphate transport system permease protein
VSAVDPSLPTPRAGGLRGGSPLQRGLDYVFWGVTAGAGAGVVALVAFIAVEVFQQASGAYDKFGLHFVVSTVWDPVHQLYGAGDFIVGTLESSLLAVLIAAPISIAIALFLTELAPRVLRGPIALLVELLASIPSVVIGLWGILILGPVLSKHIEPALHSALGFIPLFDGSPSEVGMLNAVIVLTIMVVPIVTSITRELLTRVPPELREGAVALGLTRWEAIRGVIIPYAGPGIAAAVVLGLGRALGEAIAVAQVIGSATGIHWSLFEPADTLAGRIANQYFGASSQIQIDSLLYLAAILLVIALLANLCAQVIVRRAEKRGVL